MNGVTCHLDVSKSIKVGDSVTKGFAVEMKVVFRLEYNDLYDFTNTKSVNTPIKSDARSLPVTPYAIFNSSALSK